MSDAKAQTLSTRLARGILDVIAERGLRPGDALPNVRDLAARFEVTPPTIREALRRLEATNSIEMRHGSGTYVGEGIDRALMPNRNVAALTTEKALALLEARITLEPGIAALAAVHRTDEQLERLAIAAGNAGREAPVLNFHREIARASGNTVLFEVIDSLLYVHADEQRHVRRMIEDQSRDHAQHESIHRAIDAGDAASAELLMRAHLEELLVQARDRFDTAGLVEGFDR